MTIPGQKKERVFDDPGTPGKFAVPRIFYIGACIFPLICILKIILSGSQIHVTGVIILIASPIIGGAVAVLLEWCWELMLEIRRI